MKNYNPRILIVSVGHTAAGKSTLLKYLSNKFDATLISEGKIKRSLLNREYTSEDSLDELLRDAGYKIAIDAAIENMNNNDITILDASFHKQYRRLWIYDAIKRIDHPYLVIWLYVHCENIDKVKARILKRAQDPFKHANNQADKYFIFEHIIKSFDPISLSVFNADTIVYEIETSENKLQLYDQNISYEDMDRSNFCVKLVNVIKEYLLGYKV